MAITADVLVVDDEEVVCSAVQRILNAEGFRVATAADGDTALSHPAAETARLVLLDVMLPDQSGLDVLRVLRARRPELPFVLMTGYTLSPQLAAARALGVALVLAKPFDDNELLAAVGDALTAPRKEASS